MKQLVERVAGDEESRAGVVAKSLDEQGPKFIEVVAKKSKALKENKKFTPAQVVTTLCIMHYLANTEAYRLASPLLSLLKQTITTKTL